jgi:large subunit ribosomal protein L22
MRASSTQKYVRITPRKLRLVADAVKKLTPQEAKETLPLLGKKAAGPLLKVINSAVSNAKERGADPSTLRFKEIQINEGPRMKRGRAVSRGRWHPIIKRTSHIKVIVETKEEKKAQKNGAKN